MNMTSMNSKDQVTDTHLHQHYASITRKLYVVTLVVGIPNGDYSNGKYQSSHISNVYTPNFGLSGYPINLIILQPMMTIFVAPGTLASTFDNIVATPSMDSRCAPRSLFGQTSSVKIDL